MKLLAYFADFLTGTVNLNDDRLRQLDERVTSITSALRDDATLGPLVEAHFPQGSWAHRTIIKPLPDHEFDADVLVRLTEVPAWTAEPRSYLREVRAALRRSSVYRPMVTKKNRCVRVVYVNDCHVDVVPYLVLADGREVIVNYAENRFEDTDPDGFTAWIKERDRAANGNLRKVIRLLKYLRDSKGTFSVPSVILTTLLGGRVSVADTEVRYPDVPTALRTLVADLDTWLQWHPTMPVIEDPTCPGASFNHRWDEGRYATFRTKIHDHATLVEAAYTEPDKDASLALWQRVFGDAFKAPVSKSAMAEVGSASALAPYFAAPGEEFIEEKFPVTVTNSVDIRCAVRSGPNQVAIPLSRGRRVPKNQSLDFSLTTDVPWPYDVHWKVRNFGPEAEEDRGLRGAILPDAGAGRRTETTKYTGTHHMDCYVIKAGRVVATDRFEVTIR